jgi:hypothetical protein
VEADVNRFSTAGVALVLVLAAGCGGDKAALPTTLVKPPAEPPTMVTNLPGDGKPAK